MDRSTYLLSTEVRYHKRRLTSQFRHAPDPEVSNVSIHSIMPCRLWSFIPAPQPDIQIWISRAMRTFTTLEKVEGTVSITTAVDISFSDLEIQFVGTSRSYVESLTTTVTASGKNEAFHIFLELWH